MWVYVEYLYRYLVTNKYPPVFDVLMTRWVRIAADNMLRNACAVLAGSALRGGARTFSRAQQLQQLRCLNIHEYQVRRCPAVVDESSPLLFHAQLTPPSFGTGRRAHG